MANKYLKLFNQHSEYTAFTQTADFVRPNVSHCIVENHVHYNPSLVVITTFLDNIDPAYGPDNFTVFNGQYYNPQTKANQLFEKVVVDGVVYEGNDLDVLTFEVQMEHSENLHMITYYLKTTTLRGCVIGWLPYDTIEVRDGITTIGNGAFSYGEADNLILPDSLTTIEEGAFMMLNATTFSIPKNVTTIGAQGLDLPSLETLYVYCDVPPTMYYGSQTWQRSLSRFSNSLVIYVKPELVDTYKAASVWSNYASRIQPMP